MRCFSISVIRFGGDAALAQGVSGRGEEHRREGGKEEMEWLVRCSWRILEVPVFGLHFGRMHLHSIRHPSVMVSGVGRWSKFDTGTQTQGWVGLLQIVCVCAFCVVTSYDIKGERKK